MRRPLPPSTGWGKSVLPGRAGQGARMKLVVNMIMGGMMAAFCEGLALGRRGASTGSRILEVLDAGALANPMFKVKGPMVLKGEFPTSFPLKHMQKDLRLAVALGDELAQPLPCAAAVNETFKRARAAGHSEEDFAAVFQVRGNLFNRTRREGDRTWKRDISNINSWAAAGSVSKVCLGTWAIGGWMWGGSEEKESVRTVRAALDRGVNFIDTAPVYGFGRSEEIVGKALKGHVARDRVVVATKVGLEWDEKEKIFRNSTRGRIFKEVEDSLRRLQTDYIDLYQVHWPDPLAPIEETARAMSELLEAGRIRAVGVSNYSPQQMDAFRKVAPLHTVQPPYNLFERQIEEDVLPYAKRHGIAVLAYGAICRGLLSGR